MDNSSLGSTSLEHIPQEFLNPKRKTNRAWTLVIIIVVTALALGFWNYRQHHIEKQLQPIVPVNTATTSPKTTNTMSIGELEQSLTETEIPSFHETL